MKKIKSHAGSEKIHAVAAPQSSSEEGLCFSWKLAASSGKFALYNVEADKNERLIRSDALMERLKELSGYSLRKLLLMGKRTGLETLPLSCFVPAIENMDGVRELGRDDKLYVFRFGKQKYRLICRKRECALDVFDVLAADWDYSAYDHGS